LLAAAGGLRAGPHPAAILAGRREATWNKLIEELAIEVEGDDDAAKQAQIFVRADKVANALGQARFYIGEKIYEQFKAIRWPEFDPEDWNPSGNACAQFRGSREYMNICMSMEKYKMWTEKAFVPFARDRDAKISEARKYYDSIAYLQVPAWEIAAASRVGDMFLQFWKDMYNAPTPPPVRGGGVGEVGPADRAPHIIAQGLRLGRHLANPRADGAGSAERVFPLIRQRRPENQIQEPADAAGERQQREIHAYPGSIKPQIGADPPTHRRSGDPAGCDTNLSAWFCASYACARHARQSRYPPPTINASGQR
jgi:hypothetical protein